jgi:hypothetical protein
VALDTTGLSFAEQVGKIVALARPIFGRPWGGPARALSGVSVQVLG